MDPVTPTAQAFIQTHVEWLPYLTHAGAVAAGAVAANYGKIKAWLSTPAGAEVEKDLTAAIPLVIDALQATGHPMAPQVVALVNQVLSTSPATGVGAGK